MDTNAMRLSTEGIPGIPDVRIGGRPPAAAGGAADFQGALSKALDQVQSLQDAAAAAQERLVAGEAVEAHDVMIAAEEASAAFELMMEVRNRLLEAYHEIMRMQV
jgi:flagellar hook-basal body complex protein FliE